MNNNCLTLRSPGFVLIVLLLLARDCFAQEKKASPVKAGEVVARISKEADSVKLIVKNPWVTEWMDTASNLPKIEPRTVVYNNKDLVIDEELYYSGRYGSPLAYARGLDLAVSAGFKANEKARVFDFGYGSIGHLSMLALSGHDCVGVDIAPLLKVMYPDGIQRLGNGSVHVLDGRFPKDQDLVTSVGSGFDLVITKNVLKLGYIHPTREVPNARMLIDLGVDDERFLSSIASMLKPNGLFVIYNFCPAKAPADKPYVPWAEGESPFSRQAFERAGFEILHFDTNDDIEARRLGHALKWDEGGGMNLESDLFAWYTIVRKRSSAEGVNP